jgi:uncharacterized protein (TIGR03086 family)
METDLLDAATDHFATVLAAVDDARWGDPSPCAGWTAGDVADHVTGGNRWAAMILAGGPGQASLARIMDTPLGVERTAEFAVATAQQRSGFAAATAGPGTVDHLIGPITPQRFLQLRLSDVVLHSWDLARAAGLDEKLPAPLVDHILAELEPTADALASTGRFAARVAEPAGGGTGRQDRLLRLTGRHP